MKRWRENLRTRKRNRRRKAALAEREAVKQGDYDRELLAHCLQVEQDLAARQHLAEEDKHFTTDYSVSRKFQAAIDAYQEEQKSVASALEAAKKTAEDLEAEVESRRRKISELAISLGETKQQVKEMPLSKKKQTSLASFLRAKEQERAGNADFPYSVTKVQTVQRARAMLAESEVGKQLLLEQVALDRAEKAKREAKKKALTAKQAAGRLERMTQKLEKAVPGRKWKGTRKLAKQLSEPKVGLSPEEEALERDLRLARNKLARKRVGDGKKRSKRELAPKERQEATSFLDKALAQTPEEKRGKEWWKKLAVESGYEERVLKKLDKPDQRELTNVRLSKYARKGKNRYWMTLLRFKTTGIRKPRDDLHGGKLRACKEKVKDFCKAEMSLGHDLCGYDLLDQYELEVDELVFNLQKIEPEQISEQDKSKLEAGLHFLGTGRVSRQARAFTQQMLLLYCGVVERKPDLVFPMTTAESKLVCNLSWQSFDRVCYCLSYGSEETLSDFVGDPRTFMKNVETLAIAASDAVPVYLDISTHKVLVAAKVLDLAARRRLAQRQGIQPESIPEELHITASGESRQDKDRLTWVCRQGLLNYFQKVRPGKKAPPRVQGKILKSILVVHCSTHCFLDWICPHTNTWLVAQDFWEEGKHVLRKVGDPVPATLMKSWRQQRSKNPELFERIYLMGQKKAYMDEIICSWHSLILEEEFPLGVLHQVDMFSGELTETVEALNWSRQQVKTVIGPKQTSKLQVTDITFSKLAKDRCTVVKRKQRMAQRVLAQASGTAPKLEAGAFEILETVSEMHKACVESNERDESVAKSFRRAGWLAYEPGVEKFQRAEGARWAGLPLGGSNLSDEYLADRYTALDSEGIPRRPDWNALHRLRIEQEQAAALKALAEKKGQVTACKESNKPDSAISKTWDKEEKDCAELEKDRQTQGEKDISLGFLQEYLLQTQPGEEEKWQPEDNKLELKLSDMTELEDRQDSAWISLPPKRRRELLNEARMGLTTPQAGRKTATQQEELRVRDQEFRGNHVCVYIHIYIYICV